MSGAFALDAEAMFRPGSTVLNCMLASRSLLQSQDVEFVAKNGGFTIYRKQPPSSH
jgi:hypothetical protein